MRKIISLLILLLFVHQLRVFAIDPDLTLYGNEPEFENNIILTIDDTSIESNTRAMFELLRQNGMTATFFPNTRYMRQHDPQLWRDMVAAGFEIGYHTRNHRAHMTPEELSDDFGMFQQEIRTILDNPHYSIRYVRPPYGTWDDNWMSWANANRLMTVRWNLTTATDDFSYIESVIQNREQGGSIILLHTGYDDLQWLRDNLSSLSTLRVNPDQTYRITGISRAFGD